MSQAQEPIIPSKSDRIYPSLLVITENGFGKQTTLSEYRKTRRGASGVKTMNITTKTGKPVVVLILQEEHTSLILTTEQGITINISTDDVPQIGRSTQGVKIIKLNTGDKVVSGSVA
jgi:DNA gyrase subunit A